MLQYRGPPRGLQLGDRLASVGYQDGLAGAHSSQVFAQTILKLSDSNRFHDADTNVATCGHICQASSPSRNSKVLCDKQEIILSRRGRAAEAGGLWCDKSKSPCDRE